MSKRNRKRNRTNTFSSFEMLEGRRLMSAAREALPIPADLVERINPRVWSVAQDAQRGAANPLVASKSARFDQAGNLQLYVHTSGATKALARQLADLGIKVDGRDDKMRVIQAWLPSAMVDDVAKLDGVATLTLPDYAIKNVTSAGDAIHNADKVRNQFAAQGIDGTGVKIGVISDGADHRANVGVDLPSVSVDPAHDGAGDEGTAMLEIVHDLAPGAELYFAGVTTSLDMVACMTWLKNQGCNVIVDDLLFPGEHYFSDGAIAQKAQDLVNQGVVYVTSAGNFSDQQHYQSQFISSGSAFGGGLLHRFAVGDDANNLNIPAGQTFRAFLQWSDAWGTSANDYDVYLFNSNTFAQLDVGNNIQNGNDQPIEAVEWTNSTGSNVQAELWIVKKNGAAIRELEMFTIGNSFLQFETDGDALVGQEAIPGVISVAAANAGSPSSVTDYSSRGGSTIYTNFSTQAKTVRQTLDGTAIDGVQTKAGQLGFFYNPFYGTSAAAPHAAAIAALVRQVKPGATPADVAQIMASTATDLGAVGYDTTSGAGRYNALEAVYKAFAPAPTDLVAASDTGMSSTDNITNDATPAFTGVAPAGSFVRLFVDGVPQSTVQLAANETAYTLTSGALSNGLHDASVAFASGNMGAQSSTSQALQIRVDTVAPSVMTAGYVWNTAPQKISYEFSEPVLDSVQATDLTLVNTTTSTSVPGANIALTLDEPDDTAIFTFPGYSFGALPDGDYHATLPFGAVTDIAGNSLTSDAALDFYFLNGDANHDRNVNVNDFTILAANFGQSNKTFAQGDFNYDGTVNVSDFTILAGKFGTSLDSMSLFSNQQVSGEVSPLADLLA